MNDRELLELSAKAAGYSLLFVAEMGTTPYIKDGRHFPTWNPLEDDGDALRLAIRLEMDVSFGLGGAVIEQSHGKKIQDLDDNEPYAANRRAIVRAAAEIGRRMK